MKKKNRLFLLTSTYPYLPGEDFIENEINILCEKFDVIIIPCFCRNSPRVIPDNCNIDLNLSVQINSCNSINKIFIAFFSFIWLKNRNFKFKNIRAQIKDVMDISFISKYTSKYIIDNYRNDILRGSIFYSYWLIPHGLTLSILASRYKKNLFLSRAHGWDLYAERNVFLYIPFQEEIVNMLDLIFPCSMDGQFYLHKKYRNHIRKISTQYLGVKDTKHKDTYLYFKNQLRILSVSSIITLKRVDLICKSLCLLSSTNKEIKVVWHHIGDGPELPVIKALLNDKPENLDFIFFGQLKNIEVINYYKNNSASIDCFINLSEFEGLPVSVMEALSFSIPLLLCDTGSMREQVSSGVNGILLEHNPTIEQVVAGLKNILDATQTQLEMYRCNSRSIYEKMFNAETNYTKFCKLLDCKLNEKIY